MHIGETKGLTFLTDVDAANIVTGSFKQAAFNFDQAAMSSTLSEQAIKLQAAIDAERGRVCD